MAETTQTVSGVQELITQIRDEGVQAGKQESEKLLGEAKGKAASIVAKAKAEAKQALDEAQRAIAAERANALEALKLAARDTVIRLGTDVRKAFEAHVRRLVAAELKDEDVLRDIILAIAGKGASGLPKHRDIEILLGEVSPAEGEQKGKPEAEDDRVKHFILKVTRSMLREGIELKPFPQKTTGIKVRLKKDDLEIDLTDKAVTDLLMEHLLPRYRQIVRGTE
jgi:V/A-type H+/Na+-transporting ATPase subunit E